MFRILVVSLPAIISIVGPNSLSVAQSGEFDIAPFARRCCVADRHTSQLEFDLDEARNFAAAERDKMVEFLRDCDVAILDAQYTDEEYPRYIGWGHSSLSSVVQLALDANVKRLLLFHHDPSHDDDMLDRMIEQARSLASKSGKAMVIEGAREGVEILLEAKLPAR